METSLSKIKFPLFFLSFLLSAVLTAEEVTPSPSSKKEMPPEPQISSSSAADTSPETAASTENSIPETPAPSDPNASASSETEEIVQAPQEQPLESVEKKEQQLKVRYYQVRTQVENDPEVRALQQQADHAATEEIKRQGLRAYYDLLFKKMKMIDASISDRCDTMQAAYLRHLEQVTLEPTIPIVPFSGLPEQVKKKEVAPTATTVPQRSHKKKKSHAVPASPQKAATRATFPNVTP